MESGVPVSLASVRSQKAVKNARVHAPWPQGDEKITKISAVRRFFFRNSRPIYSIGPTDFNLAGMDEWIANFRHICQIDCYDGRHPNVFVPRAARARGVSQHPRHQQLPAAPRQVVDFIGARGGDSVAVFLMFDETTEELCEELGLQVWFPAAGLRQRCDSKVETVRLGNRAGVPSVPNVLARVKSYAELRRLAAGAGLGKRARRADVPSATPATRPSSSRAGPTGGAMRAEIAAEPEVKVMKRIDRSGSDARGLRHALRHRRRAAAHRDRRPPRAHPLPRRLGRQRGLHRRLQRGGARDARALRREARRRSFSREGYRGYFDLDFLIDRGRRRALPGRAQPADLRRQPAHQPRRLRPRRRAAVPLSPARVLGRRLRARRRGAQRALGRPALHRQLERRRAEEHLAPRSTASTAAPSSGLWRLSEDGGVSYERFDYRRGAIESERDGLFLRITGPGDWRYEGADLGILVTRGRLMTDDFELSERAPPGSRA